MPLRWVIDHPERFIQIVADGPVTLKEMEEHFDAIAVAEAMGYAKLFDMTRIDPIYSDDDVMAMGARLSAYTANMESGPLAVVGQGGEMAMIFRRFVNMSPSKRPAQFFESEHEARIWLASQSAAVRTPPGSMPQRAKSTKTGQ
ncbi:MAG TPA: hypothetical protein VGM96_03385 [Reyranella sp.]|jgi:hypothetical protein